MNERSNRVLERFPVLQRVADLYHLPDHVLEYFLDCGYLSGECDALEMSKTIVRIVQSVGEEKQ